MTEASTPSSTPSPFHPGEQELQRRAGVSERMESFGSRVIRPFMPQQHRDFYSQLPFVVIAAADETGAPWVSLMSGKPGFLRSPDDHTLAMTAAFPPADPVGKLLRPGTRAGLLGIELTTRRRNRLSAEVRSLGDGMIEFAVVQSFGNCPQYIQTRTPLFVDGATPTPASTFTTLSESHRRWIATADTLFVGSALPAAVSGNAQTQGADASHRGGRPGFVRIEGDVLTIPEYPGNLHFNTMGNFLLYPRAGLCFVDFETGSLLHLTGSVELLWEPDELTRAFAGAERAWRFRLERGIEQLSALPLRFEFGTYSPNTLLTGDWAQAESRLRAEQKRNAWRPYRVTRVADEAEDIRSFYLEPADGDGLPTFEAGQFLTLRVPAGPAATLLPRNYSVSSAPRDPHLRISVKREHHPDPEQPPSVSNWLHEHLKPGDTLETLSPRGDFWLEAGEKRPAVLLAGGIGVTPILAMARHAAIEALRLRKARKLTVVHVARTMASRAFYAEFQQLAATQPNIRFVSLLTRPEARARPGTDFQHAGRLSADILQQLLPLDDYDFYLCGPAGFVQETYDLLLGLGVQDARIHAESFGPSELHRRAAQQPALTPSAPEATECLIRFRRSGFEQRWNAGDPTFLETAEKHGLSPPYSCRSGSCGSCATKCLEGEVAYRNKPTAPVNPGEILLCCSVPAAGSQMIELDL